MKKKEIKPKHLVLLPRPFRKIGVGILLLATVLIVCRATNVLVSPFSKPITVYILLALLIVGMLFVTAARRKIEDERTIALRFQAISHASFFMVIYFLFSPLLNWIGIFSDHWASAALFFLFLYWLESELLFLGFDEKYTQSRKG